MKARIYNGQWTGNHPQNWLDANQYKEIGGQLVSEWTLTDILPTEEEKAYFKLMFDGQNYYEGATPEEIAEQTLSKIALHEKYPEVSGMNWRLLQLDNLPNIQRVEPVADKGLKGIKVYEKDGILIWSIETKYWFEVDSQYPEGLIKVIKIYDLGKRVVDQWEKKIALSADDKESIKKEQRERILSYFKSIQPQIFDFLYAFFKSEIDEYIRVGDKQKFENQLLWAKDNHLFQDELGNYIVRETLSMEVPRASGGTTTVLNGILDELV